MKRDDYPSEVSVINFHLHNVSKTKLMRLHLPLLVSFNKLPADQHGNFYYQLNRQPKAYRWDEVLLYPDKATSADVVIDRLIDVPGLALTVAFNKEVFGKPVEFHVQPECIHRSKEKQP